jgi:hypothetical protein
MSNLPNQRVSFAAKQKQGWYKPTTDYFIKKAESQKDLNTIKTALKAANGIADESDFLHFIKPMQASKEGEEVLKSPIDIRGVDFITPIIEKLMGEYLELPYKYMVTVNSEDSIILRDAACAEAVTAIVEEAVAEYMAQIQQQMLEAEQQQQQSGQPQQPPQFDPQIDVEQFAKEFKENWLDDRAIKAQYILDHIYKYNDFEFQRIQAYYYWLNTNEFYTYRTIENGEVIREVISPLEGFPVSNGSDFVEDYDAFVIKRKITFSQLIEDYLREDMLSLEDIKYLEAMKNRYTSQQPVRVPVTLLRNRYEFAKDSYSQFSDDSFLDMTTSEGELYMYTCIFRSETKVKILRYINQLGQTVETPVTDDYKLTPEIGDLDLESTHINEVLITHRFGDEHTGVYTKPVKDIVQRYDSVTRSPKLPVNGKVGILNGTSIKPVGIRLLPFEIIDRILLHQIESTLAKYKGSILLMPHSLVKADNTGTTRQKYFYMRADGTLLYDDSEVDFNTIAQGVRFVVDDALGRYLETLINLRRANKEEALEIVSMNSDRNAQIDTRANVSNVQQNIYRAKLGSALLVYVFNKILERDHIADLEYSKYAYLNGLSDSFYDKDTNKIIPYSFDTLDLFEQKLGIYVTNSKVEEGKLQFISNTLAHAAAQNGDPEMSIEASTTDSIPLLKQRVKEMSEARRQFEQEQTERAEQAEDKKHEQRMAEIEAVNTKDITVALIRNNYEQAMSLQDAINNIETANTVGEDTSAKDLQASIKNELDRLKLELEQRKQSHQERQDSINNKLQEKKLAIDKQKINSKSKTSS